MSLELKSGESQGLDTLWAAWETATETEIEATFKRPDGKELDYTGFLNAIKHLRSIGLQEDPQPPKLNIMVGGGLRFTLVGEGTVQAYCRDNTLKGKPFFCILKDKKQATAKGPSEIDLPEYGVRVKLRREIPLSKDDPRVVDAVTRWASLPKAFRYMQRFSFTSLHWKGLQFDASFVRENRKDTRGNYIQATTFTNAGIVKQPTHYELEVEALSGATKKALIFGIVSMLRGLQKSYILTRESVRLQVVSQMEMQTGVKKGSFPGSQPVTLRKSHMGLEKEADMANIRLEDYNVTDKADGLRCLMVVAKNGRIYMVDRSLNVYGTDRRMADANIAEWAGTVLDGEWVTRDASDAPICRYYAFDIFNGQRGEDVSTRPFIVRGVEVAVSREAAMRQTVAALSNADYMVSNIPKQNSLSIHMKTFQTPVDPTDPTGIFKEAASVLDRLARDAPYHTDGLIFTPNASPLVKNINTWDAQFKWKPASQNSVDFLVITEKEKDSDGKITTVDAINTKLREDTNQIVRYKTLRLFVGSSVDPALVDPRDTILNKKPYPSSLQEGTRSVYKPVEFTPLPPDPMASVCYVAINAGATDAAGAAPAAQSMEALNDNIYCEETKDSITNRTIVEMVYKPDAPAGWRWVPLRVRWDKTEDFTRGIVGGTLNSDKVANDVWLSIHDPVTEYMIRRGAITEEVEGGPDGLKTPAPLTTNLAYYQRKAPQRDLNKIRGLAEFHNRYIKDELLLSKVLTAGASVIDMSVGQAGDIHKWMNARVGWVLGCDVALTGLTDNKNGAYRRYLNYLMKSKNGAGVPRMLFVQADSSTRYADGSAGQTPLDRGMLRTLWGEADPTAPPYVQDMRGMAAAGFDVASLMFSLHYFFKDRATLDGFLRNLAETVKVGGFFVGCCFDGDKVVSLLQDLPMDGVKRGNEGASDIWSITKKYDPDMSVLPATDESLGKSIDVSFISIGETYREYLVSFQYFVRRMGEIGMELLNSAELAAMGMVASTNLFSVSHEMATAAGRNYAMSTVIRTFSFLNRWFIFRRRSTTSALSLPPPPVVGAATGAPVALVPDAPADVNPTETYVSPDVVAAFEQRLSAVPRQEAPANFVIPEEKEEAEAEEEADVVKAEESDAEETGEAEEAAEEAEAEEEETEPALALATGPAYPFYYKSAAKDDLKIKEKGWRRTISTFAPFMFKDVKNSSVMYPNLEAVIGSLKYQLGSNKPELGAQLFSTNGNMYQKYLEEKRALGADPSVEALTALTDELGVKMRDAHKVATIKKTGAVFTPETYASAVIPPLEGYLKQRYDEDAVFRKILDAVKDQKVRLVAYTATAENEMTGTVEKDGSVSGANLLGRIMMKLVGLKY
jgi:mRNA capping enzyme, catalytic domain/mRNA capping enzyme